MSPCLAIFFPLSKAVCAPSTMGNMPLHSGQNTISPTRATGMPIHVRVPEAVMTFPPCVVISPRRMISLPSILCAIRLLAGSPAAVRRTGRGMPFQRLARRLALRTLVAPPARPAVMACCAWPALFPVLPWPSPVPCSSPPYRAGRSSSRGSRCRPGRSIRSAGRSQRPSSRGAQRA